jgi:hypothetical protein
MNLQNLSDDILEQRLEKLVKTERKVMHLVLQCIAEVDRRKLYLQKAYPSLFEFLVQVHGYSPSSAMRRIDGARLLQPIPEMAEKLETGTLNLSQVSLLQKAEREIKRETRLAIPVGIKRDLLFQIENQTYVKTEQLIAQSLNIDFSVKNKTTHHKDKSVTLTITLTEDQMGVLEQAQAELSHAVPNNNWADLFTYLAKKELKKRKSVVTVILNQEPQMTKNSSKLNEIFYKRKPIPAKIKKQLFKSQDRCTYVDPQTGKKCGSQHFLLIGVYYRTTD